MGTPSDARVLAALNAHGRAMHEAQGHAATVGYADAPDLSYWDEAESIAPMRAALTAADETEA